MKKTTTIIALLASPWFLSSQNTFAKFNYNQKMGLASPANVCNSNKLPQQLKILLGVSYHLLCCFSKLLFAHQNRFNLKKQAFALKVLAGSLLKQHFRKKLIIQYTALTLTALAAD